MSSKSATGPTPSLHTHLGSSMPYSCELLVFFAPRQPLGDGKKTSPESALLSRLKRYEDILRSHGINFSGAEDGTLEAPKPFSLGPAADGFDGASNMPVWTKSNMDQARETGELVTAKGKSKYFTSTLWMSLSDELRNTKEVFDNQCSSDEEQPDTPEQGASLLPTLDEHLFILSSATSSQPLTAWHPQPVHIFKLWQIFLDSVNPLVKIFHAPTVQQEILDGTADLENVSKATEALMFAIYACSITSMTDHDCQSQLCETKSALLARYRFATKQALINVGFMRSSDITVVQAFVLYLISIRRACNHQILWIYSGILLRIAQRIGLHRDGSVFGISVFETEMHRRLWWQIISLDIYSSELSGPPIEHTGPNEMLFRLIQCQVGNFLREGQALFTPGSNWRDIGGIDMSIGDRSKRVDDLEALMEEKYFRFCDPSIPLHQTALSTCHSEGPKIQDDKIRDLLFATSVKVLEFDNLIRNTASTKQYLWHADISFQWHAVICMLTELRMRTVGPDIDAPWHQVGMLFTNRPQLLTKFKNAFEGEVAR
ncbi:C6 transcription factor [Histoplasma capsulatum H143]|uniref:C6 transcription factor n=1 Tax=Ajellomyces capsulatus (strain H143) TaxID=544712 RepID=C6HAM6_AJECH|nr:C6 transcription factor [Histoplasma capsulatum H143]